MLQIGIHDHHRVAARGIKASGMGREGGSEGILDYMNVKLTQVVV